MGIKRVPTYFNEFACIGGACEDNCCIGWEVDIDDESLEVYNSVGGEFGDRLRRYMSNENSFTLKNNRCPFLICTPKVRHFWRCIFLWQRKDKNIENTRQNSNYLL